VRVLLLIVAIVAAVVVTGMTRLPVAGDEVPATLSQISTPSAETATSQHEEPGEPRAPEPPRQATVSPIRVTLINGPTNEPPPPGSPTKWPIVPSGDGTVAVFGAMLGTSTTLHVIDQAAAEERPVANLHAGSLEARTVSYAGSLVALGEPLADGATIYAPGPRDTTTLVVYEVGSESALQYDIPANVEPEAFSTDGTRLFVIDHRPANNPEKYRVAFLDLKTGELGEVLGPDKEPLDEDMAGIGRRQLLAPGGDRLYTLYTRQDGVGEHGHQGFVHVLFLVDGFAVCVDLPDGFGQGEVGTSDIVLNAIGTRMAVIDTHAGAIALLNTRAPGPIGVEVTEVLPIPQEWRDAEVGLKAMDDDGFYVIIGKTGFEWRPAEPAGG